MIALTRRLALVLALVIPLTQLACEVEVHTIPVHVIALADDDGGRATTVTQAQITNHVDLMNTIYEPAAIQFTFDPTTDWEVRWDTALNSMQNDGSPFWTGPNAVAARYPGKIVIFLRWGPGMNAGGTGFAYPPNTGAPVPPSVTLLTDNVDFIAMPNQMGSLWPNNMGFLAHEVGHYLGLYHTQPTWGRDIPTIQGLLDTQGLAGLDGDGLADTPPDAADAHWLANNLWTNRCQGQAGYISPSAMGPVVITPDRGNVMGYFWCGTLSFSGSQILKLRETLQHEYRRHLIEPVCLPDHHRLPAEDFQRCVDYWVQKGRWPVTVSATQTGHPSTTGAGGGAISMTSSIQPGAPRWVRHLVSWSGYQSAFDDALAGGFRPEQVQGVRIGGSTRYNAVWTPIDGTFWSHHDMTPAYFNSKFAEYGELGWQLVDFNVFDVGGSFRVAATWVNRPHNGYVAHYDMSAATYDGLFDTYHALGFEVVRFSSYRDGGIKRYAALWHPRVGPYVHHPWQTPAEHQANYNVLSAQGFEIRQLHDYDGLISAIWHLPSGSTGGSSVGTPATNVWRGRVTATTTIGTTSTVIGTP